MAEQSRKGPNGSEPVRCFGCVHLVTTYERRMPYACRLMGMKSRVLPSIEVRRASGQECKGFERRGGGRRRSG